MPSNSEELVVLLDSLERRLCSLLASGASYDEIWHDVVGEAKRIEGLAVSDADIEVVQPRVYDMLVRNYMIPSNDFQPW